MKITGEWLDGTPQNNPESTSRQNKNVLLSEEFGSITNEKGFEVFLNQSNLQKIGVIPINNNRVVLFSIDKTTNYCSIGVLDDNANYNVIYTETVSSKPLRFNVNYPIHGEYTVNVKNEVIVTWTDGINPPKILNINQPKINDIQLFNVSNAPLILDSFINDGGGDLLTGTYFPIFRLYKEDNSYTQWHYNYSPIYINDDSKIVGKINYDGSPSGRPSKKSIGLSVLIPNDNYSEIEIGYLYVNEGVTTAYIYSKEKLEYGGGVSNHYSNITKSNYQGQKINVKIKNNINKEVIDLAEVIVENASYKTAKVMASDRNELFLAGLTRYQEPDNLQQIVNNIRLTCKSTLIYLEDEPVSDKYIEYNNHMKGLAHGEVYAFYVRFEWKYGWGKWYVCNSKLLEEADRINDKYKKDDTVELISDDGNGNVELHFGTWENTNEEYPTGKGFPTGKVRHFKTPSLRWMKENIYSASNGYGVEFYDKLGVIINNLDLNSIVDCEGNSPISVELGYAKRNGYNNLVQGQTPVLIRQGFNFTFGDIWNDLEVRLYPFELLHSKSSIIANSIKAEYSLLSNPFKQYQYEKRYDLRIAVIDYTKGVAKSETIGANLFRFANFRLVPHNVKDETNNINNLLLEEHLKMTTEQGIFNDILLPLPNLPVPAGSPGSEETVLISLLNTVDDLYDNFHNQDIIATSFILKNNDIGNTVVYGGDTFICDYSFHTIRNMFESFTLDPEDDEKNNITNGHITVRRLIVESQYNINLRHSIPDETLGYTKYYPKHGTDYLGMIDRDRNVNAFNLGYNTDYNKLLEVYGVINKGIKDEVEVDQFKIIKSQAFSKESPTNNWRYFKQNDYLVIAKDKGAIVNIVPARDFLYIHTEKSLFRTRSRHNYQINSSGEEVYIGEGNIFDVEPFPVIHSKEGELGTQHKFSCQMTKYGYLFINAEKGKVYLINDRIIDLSEKGLHNFFKDNLNTIGDNPYFGNSLQTIVDDEFKRIIITRNNNEILNKNNFKGIWKNEKDFVNSLNAGDIVYYNGNYHKYVKPKN